MKTRNKILAFGIILSMLFAMLTMPASAASSGSCGANLTWTLDDSGTLTISGTGDMRGYSISTTPWYRSLESINSVIIETGVTSIGGYAFCRCASLTSVTIPDSVTYISEYAFYECTSLTSITIPDSITSICDCAFHLCNFTSITIPDSITNIDYGAFSSCHSLISITIPDSVTSIGDFAFEHCDSLTSVTIPDGVTSIGEGAFSDCPNLTDVYYGGDASDWGRISIGNYNSYLTGANIHYNSIFANKLTNEIDYSGETVSLPDGAVLDTGENLNFRNGYVNTGNGYVKSGNKKITGSNIHFTESGKMRLDASEVAKVERDNGDGTTDQGFIAGVYNPTGIIRMTLSVSGTVNETDYTGRTISKDFDFTAYELGGLVNFGFEVKRVPKPLELAIKSIE